MLMNNDSDPLGLFDEEPALPVIFPFTPSQAAALSPLLRRHGKSSGLLHLLYTETPLPNGGTFQPGVMALWCTPDEFRKFVEPLLEMLPTPVNPNN